MSKSFYSLGLMSGTSMDGVDASIIQSDGETKYKVILDKYFEYPKSIYKNLTKLRDKIRSFNDLKEFSKELKKSEREITLFHGEAVNQILRKTKANVDFLGFHGQTIYHSPTERVSKQLADGKLLSKITKKTVLYDFRENDLKNGGEGAPLTPIFHKLLVKQNKIKLPVTILNIGGIANITSINDNYEIVSQDIGPGNCLIDTWIRLKSNKKYDDEGLIARSGKFGELFVKSIIESYLKSPLSKKKSFNTNDFVDFISKNTVSADLSLEDFVCTITEITAKIISLKIKNKNIYVCGGGRKNKYLIEKIEKKIKHKIKLIDRFGVNGDFVESQAFAYLAIRSFLKLPISFPGTTGVEKPCAGGRKIEF